MLRDSLVELDIRSRERPVIALLGDDRGHYSHQELNHLIPRLMDELGVAAEDAGAEVLEFPDRPFYVTSMFQPHIGASQGTPIHPLIREFVGAVTRHHESVLR